MDKSSGTLTQPCEGVGVAIPGYSWTFLSWPTWIETMSSPIRDKDSNSYLVVHTNKMSMLKELGVLAAVCMLNQQGCNKTLEVYVDNSGAVFAFINIVSQSLGVNVVVTDITQRSDTGSCVADNLSNADTSTLGGFMKNSKRALLIPNTISEWM